MKREYQIPKRGGKATHRTNKTQVVFSIDNKICKHLTRSRPGRLFRRIKMSRERTLLFVSVISFLVVLPCFSVNAQTAASNVTVVKSPTWAGFGIEAPNAGVTAIRASFKQPAL